MRVRPAVRLNRAHRGLDPPDFPALNPGVDPAQNH